MNWYTQAKLFVESMSTTQVGDTTVISEDNRIEGAAVKCRGKIFVAPMHALAWELAEECLGKYVSDILEAAYREGLDLSQWEGFMTSQGFVSDRKQATEIARKSKQIPQDIPVGHQLRSEDLIMPPAEQSRAAFTNKKNVIYAESLKRKLI